MATKQNAPYRLGEVPSPQIKALPAVITHGAKIPSRQRGIDLMRQSSMDASLALTASLHGRHSRWPESGSPAGYGLRSNHAFSSAISSGFRRRFGGM